MKKPGACSQKPEQDLSSKELERTVAALPAGKIPGVFGLEGFEMFERHGLPNRKPGREIPNPRTLRSPRVRGPIPSLSP